MMQQLPNLLSLLRFPAALLFLQDDPWFRLIAIFTAMLTDFFDGFFARRYGVVNKLGTYLDPLTDKFFVLFVLGIFLYEHRLTPYEILFFLCRDISVIFYGIYLLLTGRFTSYKVQAIWSGKITTTLQFLFLIALTFEGTLPSYAYAALCCLGILTLFELFYTEKARRRSEV